MADVKEQSISQTHLQTFSELLEEGTLSEVREKLSELHSAEIAFLIESVPSETRSTIWELVPLDSSGDILLHVNDEVRAELISQTDKQELVAATEKLDTDDLADIFQDLPDIVSREVLQSMDLQDRQRLEAVLSFPDDTAGGLMNTDTITIRPDISLETVFRYLRFRSEMPDTTDNLIVVDRKDNYLGVLSLTKLLTNDPALNVSDIMGKKVRAIPVTQSAKEVASMFEKHDLVSAPVVDENNILMGRITIDDVVDVIRDEADHSFMRMAGLNEEDDMFAPVVVSSRRRTIWLGVNLVTALLAAWVIGLFDATIEKMVALAVLMPVVASMGGIAGSQTLTLVIRGIALDQIGDTNARQLLMKELAVGALNGLIWASIIAGITILWFNDFLLGAIIAAAILINLIVAALAGATIPLFLKKLHIDPALAGNVVLTTVTDVVGFFAFLSLAALFLV
ncbi:MAG: magnesium transporter [Gammaproteobacteria bacterium]|nr:magnesium transporter [Gammaproteobacteria bacterium]